MLSPVAARLGRQHLFHRRRACHLCLRSIPISKSRWDHQHAMIFMAQSNGLDPFIDQQQDRPDHFLLHHHSVVESSLPRRRRRSSASSITTPMTGQLRNRRDCRWPAATTHLLCIVVLTRAEPASPSTPPLDTTLIPLSSGNVGGCQQQRGTSPAMPHR
ncbi:hypothetical protein ACLOJK_019490 [Asimina triloba]